MAALLLALGGGAMMGCYPAFIKTPAVLAAAPHPIVFQCYKSSVVFVSGFFFMLPRWHAVASSAEPDRPLYHYTGWALVSAAAWVPTGVSTIYAVPRVGMGMTTAVSSSAFSVLSFILFWLVFQDSPMKAYACPLGLGCHYYRAPIYLAATLVGIFAMVFSKQVAVKLRLIRPVRPTPARTAKTPPRLTSCTDRHPAPLPPSSDTRTVSPRSTQESDRCQDAVAEEALEQPLVGSGSPQPLATASSPMRPMPIGSDAPQQSRRRWVEGMAGCGMSGVLGTVQCAYTTAPDRRSPAVLFFSGHLAHFCSFFRHVFAVLSASTPSCSPPPVLRAGQTPW